MFTDQINKLLPYYYKNLTNILVRFFVASIPAYFGCLRNKLIVNQTVRSRFRHHRSIVRLSIIFLLLSAKP